MVSNYNEYISGNSLMVKYIFIANVQVFLRACIFNVYALS